MLILQFLIPKFIYLLLINFFLFSEILQLPTTAYDS